jgi:hypothetical protein
LGYLRKIGDKFSSVKEQAFNFMWDGSNWERGVGKYFAETQLIK